MLVLLEVAVVFKESKNGEDGQVTKPAETFKGELLMVKRR